MSRPTTAREALVAELMGDVGTLLTRVEALTSTLDHSRGALTNAAAGVIASVESFRAEMEAISARAKVKAIEHIAKRTDEMASQSIVKQRDAIGQAARVILSQEIAPAVQRLIVAIERTVERSNRSYEVWLTHGATAVLSAVCSAWLVYLLTAGR